MDDRKLKAGTPRTPAPYWSTVACCEEADTRQENWGQQDFTASVVLRVPWANRFALVQDIRDNNRPYIEMNDAHFASASIRPFNADTSVDTAQPQIIKYPVALVTVNYSTGMRKQYFVEALEPKVESYVLPYEKYAWKEGSSYPAVEPKEAPGQQRFSLTYSVQIRNVLDVDTVEPAAGMFSIGDFNSSIGHVNAAAIKFVTPRSTNPSATDGGYGPGQVLLYPSVLNKKRMPVDDSMSSYKWVWDYTLKYGIRENQYGWNAFWRNKTKQYERIYTKETEVVYESFPDDSVGSGSMQIIKSYLPQSLLRT